MSIRKDRKFFKVLERSGNLAVRIFRKQGLDDLELSLTPQVEKLDGKLDLQTARGPELFTTCQSWFCSNRDSDG